MSGDTDVVIRKQTDLDNSTVIPSLTRDKRLEGPPWRGEGPEWPNNTALSVPLVYMGSTQLFISRPCISGHGAQEILLLTLSL